MVALSYFLRLFLEVIKIVFKNCDLYMDILSNKINVLYLASKIYLKGSNSMMLKEFYFL